MENMSSLASLLARLLGFGALFLIASAICRPGPSSFSRLLTHFGKPARLLRAAKSGDADTVQHLLAAGADVNAKDENEWTPLMWAATQGHAAVVRMLLEHDADIVHQGFIYGSTVPGWNALELAATHGHFGCAKILLEHGAKDIDDALGQALWHGHREIALLLKEHGADVKTVVTRARHGRTGLIDAAEEGRAQAARLHIEFGADVNAADESGVTALMEAAWGAADIVQMLLRAGANVNPADEYGTTALMHAAEGDSNERSTIIALLLDAGADVNAVNKEGKTALAIARENGATAAARLLEAAGAR